MCEVRIANWMPWMSLLLRMGYLIYNQPTKRDRIGYIGDVLVLLHFTRCLVDENEKYG